MKNIIKIQFIVIISLCLFLWLKGCDKGQSKEVIVVPEQKGSFKPVQVVHDTVFIPKKGQILSEKQKKEIEWLKKEYNFSQEEIDKLIAENDKLNEFSIGIHDSLQSEIKKLIQLKEFKHSFDNDTLTANISGTVKGEVLKMKLDYLIKERKIEHTVKKPFLSVNIGGGIGIDKNFSNVAYKSGISLTNAKNNQIDIEYLRVNNINYGMIGYKVNLFQLKK